MFSIERIEAKRKWKRVDQTLNYITDILSSTKPVDIEHVSYFDQMFENVFFEFEYLRFHLRISTNIVDNFVQKRVQLTATVDIIRGTWQ